MSGQFKNIGIFWEQEEWGGVDSYLRNLINSSSFEKKNIVIFSNKNNKGIQRIYKNLNNDKVKVVNFFSFNLISSKYLFCRLIINIIKPILFLLSIFQAYMLMKKYKFDVFMGQCGGYGNFRSEMASIYAAKILKFPVRSLVIHHCCARPIFWTTFLNIINNLLSKHLTSVISVSKATRDSVFYKSNLLDRQSSLKDAVIYNGVSQINRNDSFKNLHSIFKKKNKDILNIGMISRIESYKGQLDLIEGFAKLKLEDREKLNVFFIGQGDVMEIKNLKNILALKKIEKHFIFTGYLDYESSSISSHLDLLISLTRTFEGFGLSIAEAMSTGTAVLATRVGAIPEYLNDSNSKLIDPGNSNQVLEALSDFLKNKKMWDERAEKAKNMINSKFTSEIMAKNYYNHFLQNFS